ncbi:Amino acid adenylation [Xenorhabdus vietnamensis]|uniref:Amino acid adenylation n=1 Tax=Xenorhabdus vietnamensis TaxID=351656 RepID=A0A1Y2S9C1_9GAMM|nr:AMP-binding protein [Xenorhabdus vietnamensis]OTA15280.1 Amino acid adenylation [Xenorhabdus vietnamensis]
MFINDPIALNARKQAIKEYVSQQLDAEYQGCPFLVMAQSVPETDTEFVTTSLILPEKLNDKIFTMAAASPLHRLSLFSASIKYLAFLHCREPEGSLSWVIGGSDLAGNVSSITMPSITTPSIERGYLVPVKWHLTEKELEQPVKRLFGEELIRWKQVAALMSGIPPQTVSSVMPQLPEILVGYSETLPPFMYSAPEEQDTTYDALNNDALNNDVLNNDVLNNDVLNNDTLNSYSLSIWLQAHPEKTSLHMRFDPQKVEPELIVLLMERLVLLLNAMVFEPIAPLTSMSWIPEEEQERIRALSAPVAAQPLQYQNVAQAITASIRNRAGAAFLEVGDQAVNFTQLAQYTDRLLTSSQFPLWESLGDCVLIVGNKGVETILAAMACMRIGKPFCMQSSSVPERQLLDIIELHNTKTVLFQKTELQKTESQKITQENFGQLEDFFRQHGCQVVILPDYHPASLMQPTLEEPLLSELLLKGEAASPDDALFVVMTSGSEGKPKGCLNTHQALLNLSAETHILNNSSGSRFASLSNHTFDYFVLECVQALTQNIVLVIAPEEARIDAEKCVEFLQEKRIDLLFTTTVFAEDLMEQGDIPTLKRLYFGGESLRTFQKHNYQLFNLYGPGETGVVTTYSPIEHNDQKITIGKPFGGYQCAVVFPDTLEPCPIGVPGELLIGGIGVGRGYINRPDLTEKAFINLNTEWLSGKYYRSGDLCCWNTQGELEILGRRDRQLKVNGFRIELDAIEKHVLDLPMVSEAAVIGLEDKRGHARLGAFIVVPDGGQITEQNIREALLNRMPAYMVPSQIILVPELPLTRTGKLDRQALKQLMGKTATDHHVRPTGATQEWLVACWRRHLELETDALSVDKSFFALGGHSLRAVRVLAEIQQKFGQIVSLQAFFQNDSIEMLAKFIDSQNISYQKVTTDDQKVTTEGFLNLLEAPPLLSPDGRGPLSAQEARLYAQYRLHPELLICIVPLEIPLPHKISADAVKRALQVLLDRHDILRTRYRINSEGIPYAETLPSLLVDQILVDDQSQWLQMQVQAFDLGKGPLLRGYMQDMDTEHACLQLQIHHILMDKPSLEILQSEFEQLLIHAPLAPVALDYRRYAMAQMDARQRPIWDQAETFWKNYMEGLEFDPFGHGAVAMGNKIRQTSWRVSVEHKAEVKRLCQSLNVTPAMFFLTVWGITVAREGRSNLFSISVANALRPKQALGTVGMFVSLAPSAFRFDQPIVTFDQFIKKLADEQWQAADHLFFPVEEVFALLSCDPRMFGSNPLQNVSYSYIDIADDGEKGIDKGINETSNEDYLSKQADGALNLSVVYTAQSYRLVLESHFDIFTDAQIATLVTSYQAIFQQILHHNPAALQINELIVSDEGTQKAFRPIQRHTSYTPIDSMLLTAFQTLGDRPAVIEDERIVTWGEFAVLTAAYVQVLNNGKIRRALILGHSGSQMQAFLAACFLTRTTYLALEVGTPEERINEIIHHAAPDLIVNSDITEVGAVTVDWRNFHSVKSRDDNPIAWILYSSGTTSRPKGICVTASTVAQYIDSLVSTLGLKPTPITEQQGLRIIQQLSPSFDGYLEEVLLVWALQGTSVVADRYSLLDERKAKAFLTRHRPDIISATPALFAAWNRMPDLAPLPKICISGGDFLSAGDINHLLEHTQIWNGYGPTETCISVSMGKCARLASGTALSIGEPFDHVAFAVVDQNGVRLRAGQWGELVIYGDFEHHCYLNDPELTVRKFGQDERGIFFRSGDLAMVDKDGLFYLKGRMDDSCKVRGNFIGLGELENRARQYPGVIATGAAVAFAGTPEACLVLAIVGEENIQSGLQQYLARHYPRSHLPSAIFPIESLPRTEIGKMDRQRIVRLFQEWLEHGQQIQEEQDPIINEELQKLIDCWRKCLGYKGTLTLNSDFFLISGSSLSAVRLASQLESLFGVMFSPVDVFRNATIGEQWALIKSRQNSNENGGTVFRERFLNMDDSHLPKLILLPPALGGLAELQALANNLSGRVTVSVLTTQPNVVENLSESAFKAALINALESHIEAQANCPSRLLWLGGYSLGAEILAALILTELSQHESLSHHDLLRNIDKLVFFDPNLKTEPFDGDMLYARFVEFFCDVNHQAGESAAIGADINVDINVETLRQAFPALYQEWRYYLLQHQLLENKTFYERILALSLKSIPVEMFFSDDADTESIEELMQQLQGQVSIHRRSGNHFEFIKRLSPDDFKYPELIYPELIYPEQGKGS